MKLKELFRPKLIPNSLTLLRAMITLLIFIVKPFTCLFFLIYVSCALTDMLDGFFAALEEQIILLKLKTLHRDIKGLFEVKNL